ncbi:MAG: hypothetical protein CL608_16280 [Anaerolineaceae bacterium]|nr:hypothetical protein [Anaerolineaceae bacterium]
MKQKIQDDLTAIKGIGPARQKWLGELLDVHTFEALGKLSAEEAERVAREAGKILPNGEISTWIARAKELVVEQNNSATVENVEKKNNSPTKSLWKPIASFVVEFQEQVDDSQLQQRTRVHYMEADLEKTWPGIEREKLGLWIEQHVSQYAQVSESTVKLAEESKMQPEKVNTFKPTQVRVRQRPDYLATLDIAQPERPFLGHVHHEDPITLEVDFELEAEETRQSLQSKSALRAQCEVQNLSKGQKIYYLEMEGDVSSNCLTYKTKMSKVEPGMYRLAVLMQGKRPLGTAYVELPKLNVL